MPSARALQACAGEPHERPVATGRICSTKNFGLPPLPDHSGLPPLPGAVNENSETMSSPCRWDVARHPNMLQSDARNGGLKYGPSDVQFQNSGIDAAVGLQGQPRIEKHDNSREKPSKQSSSRKRSRFKCFFSGLWRSKHSQGA
jgi:hypothetical protein